LHRQNNLQKLFYPTKQKEKYPIWESATMKEYYIWESRCPDYHFWDATQREQIIVAASCIDEAIEILNWNNMAPVNFKFAGTKPITDESIDYRDFVHYAATSYTVEQKNPDTGETRYLTFPLFPQSPIEAYNQPNVVIRRVMNCPLVA